MRLSRFFRKLWAFRWVAVLLPIFALVIWFIWANQQTLLVKFPFGVELTASSGIVIVAASIVGAVLAVFLLSLRSTVRSARDAARRI